MIEPTPKKCALTFTSNRLNGAYHVLAPTWLSPLVPSLGLPDLARRFGITAVPGEFAPCPMILEWSLMVEMYLRSNWDWNLGARKRKPHLPT